MDQNIREQGSSPITPLPPQPSSIGPIIAIIIILLIIVLGGLYFFWLRGSVENTFPADTETADEKSLSDLEAELNTDSEFQKTEEELNAIDTEFQTEI